LHAPGLDPDHLHTGIEALVGDGKQVLSEREVPQHKTTVGVGEFKATESFDADGGTAEEAAGGEITNGADD
jgi:hypothetical protein